MSTSPAPKDNAPAFDRITTECLATPFTEWNPNLMSVYINRIEDAFNEKSKDPMVTVQDQLGALMHHVLASAPEETRKAVLDDKGDPGIRAAYMLGCLSFAHQFASHVAHRRPDNDFYEEFNDAQTKKILACLATGDLTKPEISVAAGLALATLEVKMRKLMGLGITEFRGRFRNGEPGIAEYFLTPAARAMLKEQLQA